MSVRIEGDGVAVACVARLLADAEIPWTICQTAKARNATILLSEQTQHLLQPFLSGDAEKWLQSRSPITQRIVMWNGSPDAITLPHAGVVVSDDDLRRQLWLHAGSPFKHATDIEADWVVTDVLQKSVKATAYGEHHASFSDVALQPDAEENACWVESLPQGWLFLLTTGHGNAVLIAAGGSADELLGASRTIAKRVAQIHSSSQPIPIYPQLTDAFISRGMILCGSGAMRFDPLCGEGAGNAIREAYLAAAVIRAANRGIDIGVLKEHYERRLTLAMLRHLETCLMFYRSGGKGIFWEKQAATLTDGIEQLQQRLGALAPVNLHLVDRDLIPI